MRLKVAWIIHFFCIKTRMRLACVFATGQERSPTSPSGSDAINAAGQLVWTGRSRHLDPICSGDVAPEQLCPDRRCSVQTPALRAVAQEHRLDHRTTASLTQLQLYGTTTPLTLP